MAFDKSWRYIYVSRRAATLLGKTPEEMLGKSMWALFPESPDTQFREACEKAWHEDHQVRIERYSRVLDTWVEVYIYPFGNGASAEWHDITGRERAEEASGAAARRSPKNFARPPQDHLLPADKHHEDLN